MTDLTDSPVTLFRFV